MRKNVSKVKQKHIIFHILYIIVAPVCPAFLEKKSRFYKAHRSEKPGVL